MTLLRLENQLIVLLKNPKFALKIIRFYDY
jgi:hypothetical protein